MFFDSHMHSHNSDGKNSVDEMCRSAIEKGVRGITMTDHADMNFYAERDTLNRIKRSIADIEAAKKKYADVLTVSCGVELGEYLYDPASADAVLALRKYDAVLCSVHFVPEAGWERPYNRIPFDSSVSDDELLEYLGRYFDLLSKTIDSFSFDILAHIICPVRYMTYKYGRTPDAMVFEEKIREILEKIIARGISLELNTDCLYQGYDHYDRQTDLVLKLYKDMGGEMITFGSDAHNVEDVAYGFSNGIEQLRRHGFTHYCFYESRVPRRIMI